MERYARFVEKAKVDWTSLTEEQQKELAERSVEESIADYSNTVLYSSARNAYMIPRMKRMMNRTVWAMTRQLKRGDFRPVGYEVDFGSGKIDRIDTCETEDTVYVKIIDYKTGMKAFDMAAFYHGLQMQLVVYMEEALKLEEKRHPGKTAVPAGIFYYRMKDPVVDKEPDQEKLEEAILKELRLDGLVNEEDAVIRRLDREFQDTSSVIPVKKSKGGYAKSSKTLSQEEFTEALVFAGKKREELKERMTQGDADAAPYELGKETGCDFCRYRNICGFDERIEGYEYRKLSRLTKDEALEAMRGIKEDIRHGGEMDRGAEAGH